MSINDDKSITELYFHTNMVVIVRHTLIINNTGRTLEVSPFTLYYEALHQLPIVDALISYVFPYNNHAYILIVGYSLSVPLMRQNLIPPFIM